MYQNEAQVATAVKKSGLDRSEVFLISKIAQDDHGTESARKAVAESVKNVGDYWDLYLIHNPRSGAQKRLETWRVLGSLSLRHNQWNIFLTDCIRVERRRKLLES
jgi:diketogulonate reductase-like aldo/keto reductase